MPGEEFERGLGVEAAERAGPYIRDAGQRPFGDGHGEAVRGVGEQRVDLLGAARVVEQQHHAAHRESFAQPLGEVVGVLTGWGGQFEGVQQVAEDAFGGDGVPSGAVRRVRRVPSGYCSRTSRNSSSARAVRPVPGRPAMSSTRARGAFRPESVSSPARSMSDRSCDNSLLRPRN